MPILDTSDLVGRYFILNKEYGKPLRARIAKALDDYDEDLDRYSSLMKFV